MHMYCVYLCNGLKSVRVSNINGCTEAHFITRSQCENMVVIETHRDRLSEEKAKAIQQKWILNTFFLCQHDDVSVLVRLFLI